MGSIAPLLYFNGLASGRAMRGVRGMLDELVPVGKIRIYLCSREMSLWAVGRVTAVSSGGRGVRPVRRRPPPGSLRRWE
ncbi:hypothetical protein GCM10023085_49850 [Actinomadura viridis]